MVSLAVKFQSVLQWGIFPRPSWKVGLKKVYIENVDHDHAVETKPYLWQVNVQSSLILSQE